MIEWQNSNPVRFSMMVPPEDWFWRDRDWYGDAPQEIVDEMHDKSGGTFCAMPLVKQCELLGISLTTITGTKAKGARGKWEGVNGPVSVEEYALEHFQRKGAVGFSCEGNGYKAWFLAMSKRYQKLTKNIPGWEKVNGTHVPLTPSEQHAADYLKALREVRGDIENEYNRNKAYYDRLWRPLTLAQVREFANLITWELMEKLIYIAFRHGPSNQIGWPDVTMRLDGKLRFLEIKGSDRLLGSQARWVRNAARPLGLDVAVIRVVEG